MNIEELLDVEIKKNIKKLEKLEIGTKEYVNCIESIKMLLDKRIEVEKFNIEMEEKIDVNEKNISLQEKKIDIDNRNFIINTCLTITGIMVPTFLTIWGTKKSFQFEKEGTITTIMGRGFINKLLPKK